MWLSIPLPGARVRSSHPITCLNPEPVFVVDEIKVAWGRLSDGSHGQTIFVRGENTCWFNVSMITPE